MERNTPNQEELMDLFYEVHNSYDKFFKIKDEYLSIINQPDNSEYASEDTLYIFIYVSFESNIQQLFPGDRKKSEEFDTVFAKLVGGGLILSEDEMELIGKSISFAFSQDDNFKEQYIISFLDETCRAYTGSGDITSCVKGIKERFVLCVGNTIEIICKTGCDNETYKQLDELLNPKFDVAQEALEWFQNKSNNKKLQEAIKTIMITQITTDLIDKAKETNSYNSAIASEIRHYIDDLIYSSTFDDYMGGGRKSRKSRKYKKKSSKKKSSKKKSTKKNK